MPYIPQPTMVFFIAQVYVYKYDVPVLIVFLLCYFERFCPPNPVRRRPTPESEILNKTA